MDILKIIFEHDMTLEHLSGHDDPRNREAGRRQTLESFLSPQKTYNRYYLTGTRLVREQPDGFRFGLSTLTAWPQIHSLFGRILDTLTIGNPASLNRLVEHLQREDPPEATEAGGLPAAHWHRTDGTRYPSFDQAALELKPFDILISGPTSDPAARNAIQLDGHTGIRERFEPLTGLLDQDHIVVLAEKAHHGSDLHLFTRHNLYEALFLGCQHLIQPGLRCFTINGKRVKGERHFYFETWTLDRPPHGFQEVRADSRLR